MQSIFAKLAPILAACRASDEDYAINGGTQFRWEKAFGHLVLATVSYAPQLCLSFPPVLLRSLMDVVRQRTVHATAILFAITRIVKVITYVPFRYFL
jgi:hypothetical protein